MEYLLATALLSWKGCESQNNPFHVIGFFLYPLKTSENTAC